MPFRWSFFGVDYATLITKPSLSFSLSLSLSVQQSVSRCMPSLLSVSRAKSTNEKRAKQRIQTLWEHRLASVLVRGFREIGDTVVLIVDERRVIVHRSDLVELFGLFTRGVRGIGQVAKLLVLVRSSLFLRFLSRWSSAGARGQKRQWGRRGRERSWSVGQGTAGARDGWNMRREKVRWQRDDDMRTADTLESCMCATRIRMREMCAQCVYTRKCACNKWVCVSTHRRTHSGCYYVGANPCEYDPTTQKFSKKNSSLHDQLREHLRTSFMFFLISLTETWSTNLLFNNYQMYESMFLGFPRHTCRLILDDAFVWYLILSSGSSRSGISNCVRTFVQLSRHIPWECTPPPQYLWNLT